MIRDPSIFDPWAFHHRRIVSLELILCQIFRNGGMKNDSLVNVGMRSVLLERIASAWKIHWRAVLAIVLAVATINRVAAWRRHPLHRSNLHIRLILWMSYSSPHLLRPSWSSWRELVGRLPKHSQKIASHLFWSEISCAFPQQTDGTLLLLKFWVLGVSVVMMNLDWLFLSNRMMAVALEIRGSVFLVLVHFC